MTRVVRTKLILLAAITGVLVISLLIPQTLHFPFLAMSASRFLLLWSVGCGIAVLITLIADLILRR